MPMGSIPLKEVYREGLSWNKANRGYDYSSLHQGKWLYYSPALASDKNGKRYYDAAEFEITSLVGTFKGGCFLYAAQGSLLGSQFRIEGDTSLQQTWLNEGCLVALQCDGIQLKTLAEHLDGVLVWALLKVISVPTPPTADDIEFLKAMKAYDVPPEEEETPEFIERQNRGYAIKLYHEQLYGVMFNMLKSGYKNPIKSLQTFKDAVAEFQPINSGNKSGSSGNYSGGGRGWYKPEERLEFVCKALKVEESIPHLTKYALSSPENWLQLQIALNMTGAYSLTINPFPTGIGAIDVSAVTLPTKEAESNGHKTTEAVASEPSQETKPSEKPAELSNDNGSTPKLDVIADVNTVVESEEDFSPPGNAVQVTQMRLEELAKISGQTKPKFIFPDNLECTPDEVDDWCKEFWTVDELIAGKWTARTFKKQYIKDLCEKQNVTECTLQDLRKIREALANDTANLPM